MKITYKNTELLKRLDEKIVLKGNFEGIWDSETKVLRLYFLGATDGFPGLVKSTSGDEIFELSLESGEEICSEGNIVYIEFPEDTLADISTSRKSGNIGYLEGSGYAIGTNVLRELGQEKAKEFIGLDSWYRYYRVSRQGDYRNLRRLDESGRIISQDYYFYSYTHLYLLVSGLGSDNSTIYDFNFSGNPTVQLYGCALRNVYRKIGNTETQIRREIIPLCDVPGLELCESQGTTPNLISEISSRTLQVKFDSDAIPTDDIGNVELYISARNRDGEEIRSNILRLTETPEEKDWNVVSSVVFSEQGDPVFLFQHDDYSRGNYRTLKIETSYDSLTVDNIEFTTDLDEYFYRRVRIEEKAGGSYIVIDICPKVNNSDTVWIPRLSGDLPRSCTLTCHGHSLTYYAVICPDKGGLYVVNPDGNFVDKVGLYEGGLGGIYTVTSPSLAGQYWRGFSSSKDVIVSTPLGIIRSGAEDNELANSEPEPEPEPEPTTPRRMMLRRAVAVAVMEDNLWDDTRDSDDGNLSGHGGGGGGGGGGGSYNYNNNTTTTTTVTTNTPADPPLDPSDPGIPFDPGKPTTPEEPILVNLGPLVIKVGERYDLSLRGVWKWWLPDDDSYKGIISLDQDGHTLVGEGVGGAQVYGDYLLNGERYTYMYNVTVAPAEESTKTGDFMITTFVSNSFWYGLDLGSAIAVKIEDESESESEKFPDSMIGENWRNITTRAFKEVPVIKYGEPLRASVHITDTLESKANEENYIDEVLADNTETYDYVFAGLGDFAVTVESNFPTRFKTDSDLIVMSRYGWQEGSKEYTTTNGIIIHDPEGDWSAEVEESQVQSFYIQLDTEVYEPTLITLTYDCQDGRKVEPGEIKIMILPPMSRIVRESGPAVLIIKNNTQYYNKEYYFRSYSKSVELSVEYLKDLGGGETGWTSNTNDPDNFYPGAVVDLSDIKWAKGNSTGTKARRGYFTVSGVRGLDPEFPQIKPCARVKIKPTNDTSVGPIYYFVYLLPPIPRRELSTTYPIGRESDSRSMIYEPGIFLTPKGDLELATWPNGTKFVNKEATPGLDILVTRSSPGHGGGVYLDNKANLQVDWTGSDSAYGEIKVGQVIGTVKLSWLGSEILDIDKQIDTSFLGGKLPENPYPRSSRIYTQTIRIVKENITNSIVGTGGSKDYSASGTFDPWTGASGFDEMRITGAVFHENNTINGRDLYYEYQLRKIEVENSALYDLETVPGTSEFRLTIYPKYGEYGSSIYLNDIEKIKSLQASSYGKFSLYELTMKALPRVGYSVVSGKAIADFEFTQEGFSDGIVVNDRLFVGPHSINIILSPTIRYNTTSVKVSAYPVKLLDIEKGREVATGDIEVKVLENDVEISSTTYHNGEKITEIQLPGENSGTERKTYQIKFLHTEQYHSGESILHTVSGTIVQESNTWKSTMPDIEDYWIYSYGSMNRVVEFNTMIPLRNIKIVEVDSSGNEISNSGLQVGRIRKKRDILDEDNNLESICYSASLKFSPNSVYPESTMDWKRMRYIRIDNASMAGDTFGFPQGYYAILPKYEDPEPIYLKDRWILGTEDEPLIIPSYRNTPRDEYKVLIPFNYVRREIDDDEERKINVKDLISASILEIDETESSTTLLSAADYYGDEGDLDTLSWFKSIETDIITESTDPSIELPALETVYTVSSAGFIERDVIAKEIVSLKSGILDDYGRPLYDNGKLVTVSSKIQIWYRKIGEDLKDE